MFGRFRLRFILMILLSISFASVLSEQVVAQTVYSITDLGTLGGNYSAGHAINKAGNVIGQSFIANGDSRAFLYKDGSMTNLGVFSYPGSAFSIPWAVNDHGQVVGYAAGGPGNGFSAFLY